MFNEEKVYFSPGEIVQIRHEGLENKPKMLVMEKVSKTYKQNEEITNVFVGIRTRWFTKDGMLQEAIWSTKDLEHVE